MIPARLVRRRLGSTDVYVTALGFGGAAIGNLYHAVDELGAQASVMAALRGGIGLFDTAPYYGFGLSEERLGAFLAGEDAVVSTKVGRILIPERPGTDLNAPREGFVSSSPLRACFDYSYDGVMRSHQDSCRRLRRDFIDILLAHDLGDRSHGPDHASRFSEFMSGGYRAMRELRDAGAVGAIGLGVNEWQICEQALSHGDFDCFLLAGRYTLLEQTALDTFLPLCAERGVSVLIGGPFNSGILATGVKDPKELHYNYANAPTDIITRVGKIEDLCRRFAIALPAAAIQFPLAHPQVAAVVPGLASSGEVASALFYLTQDIPDGFWDALRSEGLIHPRSPAPLSPRNDCGGYQ